MQIEDKTKCEIVCKCRRANITPYTQKITVDLTISYHVQVEENRKYRVHIVGEKVFASEYSKSRSVFGIMILPKGRYVVVPTTTTSDELGPFMLRLYTGSSSGARQVTEMYAYLPKCRSLKYRHRKSNSPQFKWVFELF